METEENKTEMNKVKEDCLTILNEILVAKNEREEIIVDEIDRELKNEAIYNAHLGKKVPKFLNIYIDKIFDNFYTDAEIFIKNVVSALKKLDNLLIPFDKPFSTLRTLMKTRYKLLNPEISSSGKNDKNVENSVNNPINTVLEISPRKRIKNTAQISDTAENVEISSDNPFNTSLENLPRKRIKNTALINDPAGNVDNFSINPFNTVLENLPRKRIKNTALINDPAENVENAAINPFNNLLEIPPRKRIKNASLINDPVENFENTAINPFDALLENSPRKRIKNTTQISEPAEINDNTPSDSILASKSQISETAFNIDPAENSPVSDLYNFMISKEDPNGISYMKIFYRLPHHNTHKLFYNVTTNPISFSLIRRKTKKNQYTSVSEIYNDFKIMFTNATSYFLKGSDVYTIAQFLLSELESYVKMKNITIEVVDKVEDKIENKIDDKIEDKVMDRMNEKMTEKVMDKMTDKIGDKVLKTPDKTDNFLRAPKRSLNSKFMHDFKKLKKLTSKNDTSRLICEDFLKLPPPEIYPDYYSVIKHPIDLTIIESKIKADKYQTIDDLGKDLAQLLANARFYNKSTSQIYKDTYNMDRYIFKNMTTKIKDYIKDAIKILYEPIAKNMVNRYINEPEMTLEQSNNIKKEIGQLLFTVCKADDEKHIKLFRSAGMSKQIKQIKLTLDSYTDLDQFFFVLFGILKKNLEKARPPSKSYYCSLTLMSLLVDKYNKLSPEIPIKSALKIDEIIETIFYTLKNLKDPYGITCWCSLSHTEYFEDFFIDGKNFRRAITVKEIESCVQKKHYKRLGCFLNDFCAILRRTKDKYPDLLEPNVHSNILFKKCMNMVNSLDKKHFSYEPYMNWADFVNDIGMHHGPNEVFGIPAICREIIESAENFTEEPINFKQISLFNHVKFRDVIYNSGDFVAVSKNNNQKVVMIRKFFMMPSGKKAFVCHIVSDPKSLLLSHSREFAENELILLNKFFCFRVKDIANKMNISQIYKPNSTEKLDPPEYFINSLYEPKYMTFFNLSLENNKIENETHTIQRSLLSPPPLEIPTENFIPNMLLHYYSRHPHSQIRQIDGSVDYFTYKNTVIKKGDFIQTIYDDKNRLYQIESIKRSEFDETSLLDGIHLSCREYIHYNQLKNLWNNIFYTKEYIQTSVIKIIPVSDIQAIVCMLTEDEYFSFRYTQFSEDEVYICRRKLFNDKLCAATQFQISSPFKDEKIYIEAFKCHQHFPLEFYRELDGSKNFTNEPPPIPEKTPNAKFGIKKPQDLLWICHWQECGHTFNSLSLLFNHFKGAHKDSIKLSTNILDSIYPCLWKDCENEDTENLKSRGNLIRHVREDHCRSSFISLKDAKDVKIMPNIKDSHFKLTRVPNTMNNTIILLRDPFIDSLFKFLEKTGQSFDMKQLDMNPLFESIPENINKTDDINLRIPIETNAYDISLKSEEILFPSKSSRTQSNLSLP